MDSIEWFMCNTSVSSWFILVSAMTNYILTGCFLLKFYTTIAAFLWLLRLFLVLRRCFFLTFYTTISAMFGYWGFFCQDDKTLNFLQVVTCGNVPLESSFHKVPRCVYTSTGLYEYRGWDSKAANSQHRRFSWGLRSLEVVINFWKSV